MYNTCDISYADDHTDIPKRLREIQWKDNTNKFVFHTFSDLFTSMLKCFAVFVGPQYEPMWWHLVTSQYLSVDPSTGPQFLAGLHLKISILHKEDTVYQCLYYLICQINNCLVLVPLNGAC